MLMPLLLGEIQNYLWTILELVNYKDKYSDYYTCSQLARKFSVSLVTANQIKVNTYII
jgi:Mn-dependent DtxR family transcriptional regulator